MDSTTSHPVPQNVTDFQFHLVGDMTIKQFGYLGTGMAAAYITYILFANLIPFFAYPLVVIFAGSGAALAFIPIQERPLDQWLISFIKAIFRPTQLKYKSNVLKKEDPSFDNRIELYLQNLNNPHPAPIIQQTAPVENSVLPNMAPEPIKKPATGRTSRPISELISQAEASPQPAIVKPQSSELRAQSPVLPTPPPRPSPQSVPVAKPVTPTPPTNPVIQPIEPQSALLTTTSVSNMPSPEQIDKTVELAKQAQNVQAAIIEGEHELNQIKASAAMPGASSQQFSLRFQQVLASLQKLNEQAANISKQLSAYTKTPVPTTTPKLTVVPSKPRSIPTMSLTSTPNIINGIVTDAVNNYLEQAIIVTHDRQGMPVRALKSNKLGQFVAATPLPSGTYTITVEKDSLLFDTIQIDLDGSVLKPILIAAKKAERSLG